MLFKPKSILEAVKTLENHVHVLTSESNNIIKRLQQASEQLSDDWEASVKNEIQHFIGINMGKKALLQIISDIKNDNLPAKMQIFDLPRYQISSLFLKESCEYLTSGPSNAERLHLVTGSITREGTIVLSRMEKVKFASQSSVYVEAERKDSHQKIVAMSEDFGHLLLAMFHSHTSNGAGSTTPSGTDIKNLERKAKIGINCLGGIFSLDGYVRFFSLKAFEIDVYGKGITSIKNSPSEKVFKITK